MTDLISTLRSQLLGLQQAQTAGALDAADFAARKAALERQLLDAVMAASAPAASSAAAPGLAGLIAPIAAIAPAAPAAPVSPHASVRLWAGVSAMVIGLAALGYAFNGSPRAIGKTSEQVVAARGGDTPTAPGTTAGLDQTPSREQLEAMVAKMVVRMQTRPDDADGWLMLGRSYMVLGRMPDAVTAYERLLKLRPDDASTLVDVADALAVTNGRKLEGEPTQLIERALKLEPDNLKALVLAGTAAFNRNDDVKAVLYWDRAVNIGPADNDMVDMARGGAAAARERSKLAPTTGAVAGAPVPAPAPTPAATAQGAAAAASASVSGTVRLSDALKAQAAPDDMVFIFARPADGSRMPLAIVRKQVKELPVAFVLDDSSSMSPAARLSGTQRVIVGARISKSGQAMPQPGDLQGLSAPVVVGATSVVVEISSKLP